VAHMTEERNAYNVFVWKCEGKRLLGKCRHRWKDNIKMDLKWKGLKVKSGFVWYGTETRGRLL